MIKTKAAVRATLIAVAASFLCLNLASPVQAQTQSVIPIELLEEDALVAFAPNAAKAVIVEGTSGRVVSIAKDGRLQQIGAFDLLYRFRATVS